MRNPIALLETRKERAIVQEVKDLAEELEKAIIKTDALVARLNANGAGVKVSESIEFDPKRTLQIASFNILSAEKDIASVEYYGSTSTRRLRKAVESINGQLEEQLKVLVKSIEELKEFHDVLVEIYPASNEPLMIASTPKTRCTR